MLAKSHGEPSKKNRKAKKLPIGASSKGLCPTFTEDYNKTDRIIDQIYCDIANGVSRSTVIKKLEGGIYEGQETNMKNRQAHNYYNAALDRFAVDTDIEAEKLRKVLWGRYESLLEEAVKKNDLYNARGVLDSMARIFGLEQKTPSTAIQLVSDKEGGITVNFGFNNQEQENGD